MSEYEKEKLKDSLMKQQTENFQFGGKLNETINRNLRRDMVVEHNHLIEFEELGVLYGRDCIFVDNVVQTGSTLKLKGKINGRLASKIHDNIWIPYELTFKQVIKYSSCELDTFEASRNEAYAMCKASFFIIQDSEYLKKMPIRYDYKKYDYKHFMVCTYDFIFNVFAVDYKLTHDFKFQE